MQRQRGELIPIGDALSGMGGPVKAIRDDSPQAVHHYTVSDQVNQLVSASSVPCAISCAAGKDRVPKRRTVMARCGLVGGTQMAKRDPSPNRASRIGRGK